MADPHTDGFAAVSGGRHDWDDGPSRDNELFQPFQSLRDGASSSGSEKEQEVPTFEVLAAEYNVDPEPIGRGAFGTVHFAVSGSGKCVAIKAISRRQTRQSGATPGTSHEGGLW